MPSMNSVILIGNLTRDPELRSTGGGTSVCQLGLAVNERYKDASGDWQERANFFDITVWGNQGENCAKYLEKGRSVAVQGRLQFRTWEKDGEKKSKVDVVANQVQFLGGGGGEGGGGRREPVSELGEFREDLPAATPQTAPGGVQISEDEIPF